MKEIVKPYGEAEGSKREQVERMFDNVASRYDFLNRVLSMGIDRGWRKRAIGMLASDAPQVILDVATGTGDVAIQVAETLRPKQVVGVDISEGMLVLGRKKVTAANLDGVVVMQQADCEQLPFSDGYFDAVTVAFGVRNFEHLERGLAEMHRVLKKNGKLIVIEFSTPQTFPFKHIYHFYFKNILPVIGKLLSKDARAYTYLYESVQAFPYGGAFVSIMKQTGFEQSSCTPLTFGICSIYSGIK